jgi:nucleotide-binding universal stress UspA family protein
MRLNIENILCTTDLSDLANRTLPYAVSMASAFHAKMFFCHVIEIPATAVYGEAYLDPVEQQRASSELAGDQLQALTGDLDIEWESIVSVGHAADEIARLAEEKHVDLVIAATHGRSGLKRLLLGSVTERLMRSLSCPVLVIHAPGRDSAEAESPQFKKILVGCDFSEMSNFALEYAISLAQEFEAELHMAHVVEPMLYRETIIPEMINETDMYRVLTDFLSERLSSMVPGEAFHWCTPKTILLDGNPDEALCSYALENRMDLIVLGTRGQSMVEKVFLGSTTDRVTRRSSCPVLSVCPHVRNQSKE